MTWPALLVASLLALLLLGAPALLAACGEGEEPQSGPAVLARVDGEAVTQDDVDLVLAEWRLAGGEAAGGEDEGDDALDEAIERVLVRREGDRLGLEVTEADVDARVAEVRERAGGAEALSSALQSSMMSEQQLRDGSAYGLLRERVRDTKYEDLEVSDAAVKRFYERHREDVFTEPAAVRLGSISFHGVNAANGVREKLRKGAAFDEMARTYSTDPEAKASGGMMGWILTSSLPAPLADAVDELAPGELSPVVQAPGGWYVLKLYGRRAAKTLPFSNVADDLADELGTRARLKALDAWVERARARADVRFADA